MLASHKLTNEIWFPIENEVFSGDLLCCIRGVTDSQLVHKKGGFFALRCRFHKETNPEKFCLKISPKKLDLGWKFLSTIILKVVSKKYPEFGKICEENKDNSVSLPIVKYADSIYVSDKYNPGCLIFDNYSDRTAALEPGKLYTFCLSQRRFCFRDFQAKLIGLSFDIGAIIGTELPIAIEYEDKVIWESEIQKIEDEDVGT